jgi:hypothetical protein
LLTGVKRRERCMIFFRSRSDQAIDVVHVRPRNLA